MRGVSHVRYMYAYIYLHIYVERKRECTSTDGEEGKGEIEEESKERKYFSTKGFSLLRFFVQNVYLMVDMSKYYTNILGANR